jgi:hypothetical protein
MRRREQDSRRVPADPPIEQASSSGAGTFPRCLFAQYFVVLEFFV